MKDTKAQSWLTWHHRRGTYKEDKYAEDAEKVAAITATAATCGVRVDNPEVRTLEDTKDGKKRYVELRIPVTEGPRYKVGDVKVVDNKVVKAEALVQVFQLKKDDLLLREARQEGDGEGPRDLRVDRLLRVHRLPRLRLPRPAGRRPAAQHGGGAARHRRPPREGKPGPAVVDVTMHMQEGEQYFVNRITFVGNTTTRDNVIRREMRLFESGVFNTEALKYSVKRLNQLGYFKPLEGDEDVKVEKTPGEKNKVDVTLKLEEQNRNQLTFGAGVSQFDGVFGQFSFSTSNFLGRGETLTLSVQAGRALEELPALVHRAVPVRSAHHRRRRYPQARRSSYIGPVHAGVDRRQPDDGLPADQLLADVPQLQLRAGLGQRPEPGLLLDPELEHRAQPVPEGRAAHRPGRQAHHQQGHAELRPQHRRQPDLPDPGSPLHAQLDFAGLGGNTSFFKPRLEGDLVLPADAQDVGRRPRPVRVRPRRSAGTDARCRSSSGCSRAAGTPFAATTSAPSARATRSAGWSSAATRACCSTREYATDRRAGARPGLLRRRPGAPDRRGGSARRLRLRRRAERSGSSCRCSTCPSA